MTGTGESTTDRKFTPLPADSDWWSFSGDAGNSSAVDTDAELDSDALEVAWSIDGASVAIADGIVYAAQGSDGILTADGDDGSIRWRQEDASISGGQTAAYGSVFLNSQGEVTAYSQTDGSIQWQTNFCPDGLIQSPNAACEAVYPIVDGTLYALEAADGSIRWKRETVAVEGRDGEVPFVVYNEPVVANGLVYALLDCESGPKVLVALDAVTGEVVWQERSATEVRGELTATETVVTVPDPDEEAVLYLHDPLTGEHVGCVEHTSDQANDGEVVVSIRENKIYAADATTGDELWTEGVEIRLPTFVGSGSIRGDEYLAYYDEKSDRVEEIEDYAGSIVAFDKYDGDVRWTFPLSDSVNDVLGGYIYPTAETLYVYAGDLHAIREGETKSDEEDNVCS